MPPKFPVKCAPRAVGYRDKRSPVVWLLDWRRDFRRAAAALRRAPGFAAAAVLTLALGIGANTAIFAAIEAVLLRSLPVPAPQQLYLLTRGNGDPRFSYPTLLALRHALPGTPFVAFTHAPGTFFAPAQGAPPQPIGGEFVSGNFFSALQLRPWQGRLLAPADNVAPAGAQVAVLSYAFWRDHYGGDPAVVGRTIILNGVALTMVGVAPPGFYGLNRARAPDLWLPLRLQAPLRYHINAQQDSDRGPADAAQPWATQPGIAWLQLMARLPDGGNAARVAARATVAAQRGLAPYIGQVTRPAKRALLLHERIVLRPGARGMADMATALQAPLLLLAALAVMVLVIAGVNVALLQLARGMARRREYAICLALGAGRGRLLRSALAESLILATLGGGLGLALALESRQALLRLLGAGGATLAAGGVGALLAFAAVVSLVTGVAFGLAPALLAARVSLVPALKGGREDGARLHGGGALIVAQGALAILLLVSAVLLARSVGKLATVNPGMVRDGVLLAHIEPRAAGYVPVQLPALYARLLGRLQALPGISSSALAVCNTNCAFTGGVQVAASGRIAVTEAETHADIVSSGYLRALGIGLRRGRDFNPGDTPGRPKVALVNQTFARRYLAGRDPIGQYIGSPAGPGEYRIVGVMADAKLYGLGQPTAPLVLYSLDQNPGYVRALIVRTSLRTGQIVPAVEAALAQVAPGMPVTDVQSISAWLAGSWRDAATVAKLSGTFALLATFLAALGMYGVTAYAVTRRTGELAVRMALGATGANILRLVLWEALRRAAIGAALGMALAWPAARALRGLLFGVAPADPASFAAALAALLAAALAATAWPARRATRVNPANALRQE